MKERIKEREKAINNRMKVNPFNSSKVTDTNKTEQEIEREGERERENLTTRQ